MPRKTTTNSRQQRQQAESLFPKSQPSQPTVSEFVDYSKTVDSTKAVNAVNAVASKKIEDSEAAKAADEASPLAAHAARASHAAAYSTASHALATGGMAVYFTADLQMVRVPLAMLPSPCPAALWSKVASARAAVASSPVAPIGQPVATFLLTPLTLARIRWQVMQLEARCMRGDYPAEKLEELVRDRVRPLLDWAQVNLDADECKAAMRDIEAAGGPTGKLAMPAAMPGGGMMPWEAN